MSSKATQNDDNDGLRKENKALLFYERPVALDRKQHRNLRLKRSARADFTFAAGVNSIPIAGEEFREACCNYPIVFAGKSAIGSIPSVLLGLHADENLFVDARGNWDSGYVPAFVRRYPFVLAELAGAEDFTVCVDESFAGLGMEDGEPLFNEDGSEGLFLKQALEFLGHYQGQMKRTQTFVERLCALDLLEGKTIHGTTRLGKGYALHGFHVIDEGRLRNLNEAQLRRLFAAGELAWIHAHLISLGNLHALSQRLDRSVPADGREVPELAEPEEQVMHIR